MEKESKKDKQYDRIFNKAISRAMAGVPKSNLGRARRDDQESQFYPSEQFSILNGNWAVIIITRRQKLLNRTPYE